MCTIRSGHDFSPLHLVLQDELCEGLGSRVSQAGRHLHPLLDRSAPAWPPPVVGQGAHPDGKPWQSYIICFISNSGQHKNGLNTLQVRSDQSCNKKSSCLRASVLTLMIFRWFPSICAQWLIMVSDAYKTIQR